MSMSDRSRTSGGIYKAVRWWDGLSGCACPLCLGTGRRRVSSCSDGIVAQGQTRFVMGCLEDVTERTSGEEELLAVHTELAKTSKRERLDRFDDNVRFLGKRQALLEEQELSCVGMRRSRMNWEVICPDTLSPPSLG